jgi:hypothetical protein
VLAVSCGRQPTLLVTRPGSCMPGCMQVTLTPAATVSFEPHPEHDVQEFASITHLANRIDSHGYYGGVRLLMVSLSSCC